MEKTGIKAIKSNCRKTSENIYILEADRSCRFEVEWHSKKDKQKYGNKIFWRIEAEDELPYQESKSYFEIRMPKNKCGRVYKLSARLEEDKYDSKAIFVEILGYCKPLVIDSQWTIQDEGVNVEIKNRQKTKAVPIGSIVTLHLFTEGLNYNDSLILEIYAIRTLIDNLSTFKATRKDLEIKIPYPIKCVDGKIFLTMNTSEWISKILDSKLFKDEETFYVKLKFRDTNKDKKAKLEYVKDQLGQEIHAVGLVLLKKQSSSNQTRAMPTNTTPLTIGKKDVVYAEYDHCKFDEITIVDSTRFYNDIQKTLFTKGQAISGLQLDRHFIKTVKVFFDFNKTDITNDAAGILSQYIFFWKQSNSHLKLNGHTDVRGNEGYNKNLAYDRCLAVKNYLIEKGISKRNFTDTIGYNESQPTVKGKKLSNEEHALNRRVEILFDVYDTTGPSLLYGTIAAPKSVMEGTFPKMIDFIIKGYTNKGCFKDGKYAHQPKIKIYNETGDVLDYDLKEDVENKFAIPIKSKDIDLGGGFIAQVLLFAKSAFINDNFIRDYINIYKVEMHTCAHYSKIGSVAVLMKVFPDVWISYHAQYDFSEQFYFNGIKVDLIKGIDTYDELFQKHVRYILFPTSSLQSDFLGLPSINDLAWGYYKDIADKFAIGIHLYSDVSGMNPRYIKNYAQEYNRVIQSAIALCALFLLIIEILIIILTKGKGTLAKLSKYYKDLKSLKKLNEPLKNSKWAKKLKETLGAGVSLDIVEPKIAENAGGYYTQADNGEIGYVYKYSLTARPLIGINLSIKNGFKYQLKGVIGGAIKEKTDDPLINEGFSKLFSVLGMDDVSLNVSISGNISFTMSLIFNSMTGKTTWIDHEDGTQKEKAIDSNKLSLTPQASIEFKASFTGKASKKVIVTPLSLICSSSLFVKNFTLGVIEENLVPERFKTTFDVGVKAKAEVKSSFRYGLNFVFDDNPYYEQFVHFTGLYAMCELDGSIKKDKDKNSKMIADYKLKKEIILKGFYYPYGKTYLGSNNVN